MENIQTLKIDYEDYLGCQRGLSERTIYHCWRFADRFIAFRFKGKSCDLSKLKAVDIAKFMEHLTSPEKTLPGQDAADALAKLFPLLVL